MYYFAVSAMSNYHKLSGFKQHRLQEIRSPNCVSWGYSQGYILSPGGICFLAFSSFKELPVSHSSWPPSSIFKVSKNIFEWPSFHSDPLAFCVRTLVLHPDHLSTPTEPPISTSLTAAGMALYCVGHTLRFWDLDLNVYGGHSLADHKQVNK